MDLTVGTKDARGRELHEGDEIILNVRGPIFFRIAAITPTLDPTAPPDLLMVHIGAVIPFAAKRGAINPEFIRVRTREEAGPVPFETTDIKVNPDGPLGDKATDKDKGGILP